MSVPHLLRDVTARLAAANIPAAGADARRLVAHALGVEPDRLHWFRAAPSEAQLAMLEAAVTARLARQPVSQIVGWRDFWKHRFTVTRDTLDPRPETETLVATALERPWQSVLDLGTGTGAILLSLLAERPGTTGMGVDLSDTALEVAAENAKRLQVEGATFRSSDWFSNVAGQFDLIVSNPPYIAASEMEGLSPEVLEWEPRHALTDEGDGLAAYRAIVAGAGTHLRADGWLMVEIGPTQGQDVSDMMRQARFIGVDTLQDLDGRDRVVLGQFPAENSQI
ncbi:MAG: peptide chain release factor N(5)-glutamine methyltransferase [Paracoccus denitrificans]|nr:MAG: peptide chain release factor N(5)-glutamine methyltransferase [Paracoccus denitrificans]PZO85174.1 MAG: peptide chain release factor N(5)-glutamine methyltransferase [Paracoccus denitrificans]